MSWRSCALLIFQKAIQFIWRAFCCMRRTCLSLQVIQIFVPYRFTVVSVALSWVDIHWPRPTNYFGHTKRSPPLMVSMHFANLVWTSSTTQPNSPNKNTTRQRCRNSTV